jgi:hypothetical protein
MSPPEGSGAAAGWRAVFVVGAGRSGTSALTRGLAALGVALGDRLKAPSAKNPTGFFEDEQLLEQAKRVRDALGLWSESVALVDPAAFDAPAFEALARETADLARRRFGAFPVWGFKYAQTLRFLPFWERVARLAALDVAYLVALRSPLSVARSRAKLDPLRGEQEKSDAEWLVNVVPFFRRLARRPFVVVDFDALVAKPEAELVRVAERLALPLGPGAHAAVEAYARDFLDAERRHTSFGDAELDADPRVSPLARDAYRCLRRLARDEVDAADPGLWSEWARIEAALAAQAPLLRHVDRLEAALRRRSDPLRALLRRLGLSR